MIFSKKQITILTLLVLVISTFNVVSYTIITGRVAVATVSFTINGAPYLNLTIPNQTWPQDIPLVGIDLDDHFVDPEGDVLNYTAFGTTFVTITIDPVTNVVTFIPLSTWWGIDYAWFNATDPYNARGISNQVMLNVTYTPPAVPGVDLPSGGGGGGGEDIDCVEQWVCRDWTPCIEGIQIRRCRDLAYCGTNHSIPAIKQTCHIPSCSDRIENQNETDVDCGGPCTPCKTCFDNIQNCHDGLCELGIDCDGPCLPCELSALKEVEFLKSPWITLAILLIVIFSIEAYLYATKRRLREQMLPLRPKKMKQAAKKLLQYMNIKEKEDKDK